MVGHPLARLQVCKCPLDLWIYQEIVFRTRPDVIVETGTFYGGSALYLASLCDLLGNGRVIIDRHQGQGNQAEHPRILYLEGSSVAPEVVDRVKAEVDGAERVMVILDSDHKKDHVLGELQAYGPMVTEDCYLIVEDTPTAKMVDELPARPRRSTSSSIPTAPSSWTVTARSS